MLKTQAPAYLEITIVDGKLMIDGHGFKGEGCHELASIFTAMGDKTEYRRKPEFFKGETDEEVTTVRNR